MGRPINKRYLGDAENSIRVSHYRRVGETEAAGDDGTYIVNQRSTREFLVADDEPWQEILTLVDKDAGSLAEGEFRISGRSADGTEYNVTRLYNNVVRFGDESGEYVKSAWSVHSSTGLEIDDITTGSGTEVAVATVQDHGLSTGDQVKFIGVTGTTELNGNEYTVTVSNSVAFSLDGTDGDDFTGYTSGGEVITNASDQGSIDLQNA